MGKDKRPFKIQKKRAGDVKKPKKAAKSGGGGGGVALATKKQAVRSRLPRQRRSVSRDSADEKDDSRLARPEEKVVRNAYWTLPFQPSHRILLVGEGASSLLFFHCCVEYSLALTAPSYWSCRFLNSFE